MTRPCLVVGLGGVGVAAMLEARRLYGRLPASARRPASFLGIGLESDLAHEDRDGIVVLASGEMREALAHLDVMVDGRPAWQEILDWFPDRHRFVLDPPVPEGTGGARPLGRLALWSGRHRELVERAVVQRLGELLCEADSIFDRRVDVLILTSAWGGTGSAISTDIARLCRRLGRLCRQDLILTLPSDAEPGAFENTFATLADTALVQQASSGDLGGGSLQRSARVDATVAARGASVELVGAWLCGPLQRALDLWRQGVARARFETVETRPAPRLHAAAAASLPLVRVEGSLEVLAATLDSVDELSEGDAVASGTSADRELEPRGSNPGAIRIWSKFVRGVERVAADSRRRLRRWQRGKDKTLDSGRSRRRRTIEPEHLILAKLRSAPSVEAVKAVLHWIESDDLFANLEDLVDDAARAFEARGPAQVAVRLSKHQRMWRGRVPDTTTSSRRLGEVIASIQSIHGLIFAIDALSGYRRALIPRGLLRRNDELLQVLEAEAIALQDWPDALGPVIRIAALEMLESELSNGAPSEEAPAEPVPEDEIAGVNQLEGRAREALLSVRPATDDGAALEEWLADLDRCRDAAGGWWVPAPGSVSVEDLMAACNVDVFVSRVAVRSPRALVVVIPEGLYWPEGGDCLEAEIRRVAERKLAADVRIVYADLDRLLFYVEERDQPLANLEAIHRFRQAYEAHPNPGTLHIDRRWAEGADLERLRRELESLGAAATSSRKPAMDDQGADKAN